MGNIKAGDCLDCRHYWTVTGGGLNDDGQCIECARRWPAQHPAAGYREANDYEMPHDGLAETLAIDGVGLGV